MRKTTDSASCLNCGAEFEIVRDFKNRNARIRYCNKRKKEQEGIDQWTGNKTGAPRRISKFSKSGTVSIFVD